MWKNVKLSFTLLFIVQISAISVSVEISTNISDDYLINSADIVSSSEATTTDEPEPVMKAKSKNEGFRFWMKDSTLEHTVTAEATTTEKIIDTTRTWIPIETPDYEINVSSNRTNQNETQLSETQLNVTQLNETQMEESEEKGIKKTLVPSATKCSHYNRAIQDFDLDKMVDVWQTIYYQLNDKVHCFKIYIKKLDQEDKEYNKHKYGNFNGKVDWNKCNLEIKSASKLDRKHFLQGDNQDGGIMSNIIIEDCHSEEKCDQDKVLREEVADQWYVSKNLLLMKDCDTGGILVFARVPFQPTHANIVDALKAFGEKVKNGRMACEDNEINGRAFDEDDGPEPVTDF